MRRMIRAMLRDCTLPVYIRTHPVACNVGGGSQCGSKLGYLKATVSFGLKHHEVGAVFADYLSVAASA
jgi:UTP-glucose-1-phosphate uridylyltransferase